MAKLVVMLRVKDSIFFIHEWLQSIEKIADEIVALDNGSVDGTDTILAAHPKVVDIIKTQGFNEGRDKNLLYERMRLRSPDWCLWIDIDEIFEPHITRAHFDRLMASRLVNKFAFRRFHFIDREHFAGSWYWYNYSSGPDRILWREQSTGYFENKILDSPTVKGITGTKSVADIRIKHIGYINKDLVDKKAAVYRTMISKEKEANVETMYLHNERKVKWRDNRRHPSVFFVNVMLDCLLLRQYFLKACKKFSKMLYPPRPATEI